MDGDRRPPAAAAAASAASVLDDDNLLREILLCVAFPTSLVNAALVCKRWLLHASSPAFLRRFRERNPPCLLGVYFKTRANRSRFVPMLPQPPENNAVISRASSSLDAHKLILDECNGIIFTKTFNNCDEEPRSIHIVLNPLCPARGMVIVPPFPCYGRQDGYFYKYCKLLFEEESDGLSYLCVRGELSNDGRKSTVYVYMLQDGVWCLHTSPTTQLPCRPQILNYLLVDNKIYMAATQTEILVLDLTASSLSTIQLPQGVSYNYFMTMLSSADDASGVYLIHVEELQLRIWLHKGDNSWLLIDSICLREMYANLNMSGCMVKDEHTIRLMNQVVDYGDFLFLEMGGCVLHLDIKCRTLRKVYEITNGCLVDIYPFMMIWPPTFPTLKYDSERFAFFAFK